MKKNGSERNLSIVFFHRFVNYCFVDRGFLSSMVGYSTEGLLNLMVTFIVTSFPNKNVFDCSKLYTDTTAKPSLSSSCSRLRAPPSQAQLPVNPLLCGT